MHFQLQENLTIVESVYNNKRFTRVWPINAFSTYMPSKYVDARNGGSNMQFLLRSLKASWPSAAVLNSGLNGIIPFLRYLYIVISYQKLTINSIKH